MKSLKKWIQSLMICGLATTANADGISRGTVQSPDGVTISVLESGNPNGPAIVFVHGFSQSGMAWRQQLESDLQNTHRLIAMDLRGHGYSSKPTAPQSYVDSGLWADDINAVVTAKGLNKFTLVGWSYGGLPVLDYVQKYGQNKLSGLVFVATGYNLDLRPPQDGGPEMVLGAGVVENTAPMAGIPAGPPGADADGCGAENSCHTYERQFAATKRFLDMVPANPLPQAIVDEALAYNIQTPPFVRRAMVVDRFMIGGPLDHVPTLKTITVPVLLIHGDKDQHVLPRSTEIMQSHIGGAKRIVYENVGHAPFLENTAQFNNDLSAFAK